MINGLLVVDPGLDVWYGLLGPDEEWFEDEEEVPEWKYKPMVIRRRGSDS